MDGGQHNLPLQQVLFWDSVGGVSEIVWIEEGDKQELCMALGKDIAAEIARDGRIERVMVTGLLADGLDDWEIGNCYRRRISLR